MLRRKINPAWFAAAALCAATLAATGSARAQDVSLPEPVATPTAPSKDGEPEIALDVDREIDLANVVTSAAKGVTTVQEAPSIITIITSEDIKARGFKWINEALSTVPGWLESSAVGNQIPIPMVRGVQQAMLLLHDGVSMFDPWGNIAALHRSMPMENIKRIEVVTGPGGVLWGANSFLGIVNIIMKDAEDVNGLEVSAGYGDGPGNVQDFRAYAMFGKSFFKGKLKIFQHASYESYVGQVSTMSGYQVGSPAPQPPGPVFYGSVTSLQPTRSWLVTLDGKYSLGPVTLYYNVPVGDNHPQITFANAVVPRDTWNTFDRYVILEYKDRFWKDRFGITAKGYWTQFNRQYSIQLYPPNGIMPPFTLDGVNQPGGLHFDISKHLIQRGGATIDTDLNLPYNAKNFSGNVRFLVGGEVFYEGVSNDVDFFDQSPTPATQLPIYCPAGTDANFTPVANCPRQFLNDSSRVVVAGYVNAQWRPFQKLTLDGGVRLQKGLGNLPYELTPLYSGAIVWNFLPDFHLKANYATGFRPPVFQNTSSALGGLDYGGNPNLKTESSQSFQGEVNARLLRNVRKVRELELRADYSYTFLDRVIVIKEGSYGNSGKRAIHSVEGYAKLYLNGDHFIQASYTYLNQVISDSGAARGVPNNWVTIGASFNLIKNMLDVNANLTVLGAYEDPNRYVSSAGPPIDISKCGPTGACVPGPTTTARTTDLTLDRLTPVALLQLGFRLRFLKEKIGLNAQFYNVLNQKYYYPDEFYDLTPSVEMTPTPAPGFNAFISVAYHP